MLIAVCDDCEQDRQKLIRDLNAMIDERHIIAEIRSFSSGESLLLAMEEESFPICFLDIFMGGISGVDLARHLRRRNEKTAIVFTTTSKDYMADGFEVGAVHYLIKPFDSAAVGVALDRCIYLVGEAERFIEVMVDRQPRKVLLSELCYAESQNKACILHRQDGELHAWMALDELERVLNDPRFLRCQRSYLINLDYVREVRGTDFILANGTPVPMRRENRAAMKSRFEEYLFEKARRR